MNNTFNVYNLVSKDSSGKKRLVRSFTSFLKAEELLQTLPNKETLQIEFSQVSLNGSV